ncbi:hypothetical protein T03_15667 [Trichinella britovi]|uniref:Uncharacterized protein n=1 Tax=Trichinella britovi TaxID=45882 RepID=A0A0V1BX41_TRIBR|nr:hypothetical protein T03_15667 [Trichinella britovi]
MEDLEKVSNWNFHEWIPDGRLCLGANLKKYLPSGYASGYASGNIFIAAGYAPGYASGYASGNF